MILETFGYQVVQASGAKEAIYMASSNRPDLILMDLSMPEIDGFVATAALRSISTLKDVPIVAMTAHSANLLRDKALAAGCDAFLEKPLTMERLTAILHQFRRNGHQPS
jgi:CheY-like chemotaxis protein